VEEELKQREAIEIEKEKKRLEREREEKIRKEKQDKERQETERIEAEKQQVTRKFFENSSETDFFEFFSKLFEINK
jgi:hypothetical protein